MYFWKNLGWALLGLALTYFIFHTLLAWQTWTDAEINSLEYANNHLEVAAYREVPIGHPYSTVTAYSKLETCPHNSCITASGKHAKLGMAACPREIPFGTVVSIENVDYVCEDRTALRFNGRFDIFMGYDLDAYTRALEYGKKRVQVIVRN